VFFVAPDFLNFVVAALDRIACNPAALGPRMVF
jgi:hypothetical protein